MLLHGMSIKVALKIMWPRIVNQAIVQVNLGSVVGTQGFFSQEDVSSVESLKGTLEDAYTYALASRDEPGRGR